MKRIIILIITSLKFICTGAQNNDSLNSLLTHTLTDTGKVRLLALLSYNYFVSSPDSGLLYAKQGLDLSRKTNYEKGEADCLFALGTNYWVLGNYEKCFEAETQALHLFEKLKDNKSIIKVLKQELLFTGMEEIT